MGREVIFLLMERPSSKMIQGDNLVRYALSATARLSFAACPNTG